MSLAPLLNAALPRSRFTPSPRWRRSRSAWCSCGAEGNAAAPDARLDLGGADGRRCRLSSFWIHEIRLVGPWSPIHLLSIFTLVMLPVAVWRGAQPRGAPAQRRP